MGYYTNYSLDHSALAGEADDLPEQLTTQTGYEWTDELVLYNAKWYEHDRDMAAISKRYPNVLFTLTGEGEEAGDIWKNYYKNGKVQKSRAQITFDEFNESELKKIST